MYILESIYQPTQKTPMYAPPQIPGFGLVFLNLCISQIIQMISPLFI